MNSRRGRRRRRKKAVAAGQPGQIYLREAGRRRRPWLALALVIIALLAGLAVFYAVAKAEAAQPKQATEAVALRVDQAELLRRSTFEERMAREQPGADDVSATGPAPR